MKAAAICLRWHESQMQVLLVRSSHKGLRVFPKGGIHEHESPWEAALRELDEEAGHVGFLDTRRVGEYSLKEEPPISAYLVKSAQPCGASEAGRDPQWWSVRKARQIFRDEHDPETALSMVLVLWDAVERWRDPDER